MLVLSRKLNEEIQIGEGVIVRVVAITNDKVRLGETLLRIEAAEKEYEQVQEILERFYEGDEQA